MLRGFSMGARLVALLSAVVLVGLVFIYVNQDRFVRDEFKLNEIEEPKINDTDTSLQPANNTEDMIKQNETEQDILQDQVDDVMDQLDLK